MLSSITLICINTSTFLLFAYSSAKLVYYIDHSISNAFHNIQGFFGPKLNTTLKHGTEPVTSFGPNVNLWILTHTRLSVRMTKVMIVELEGKSKQTIVYGVKSHTQEFSILPYLPARTNPVLLPFSGFVCVSVLVSKVISLIKYITLHVPGALLSEAFLSAMFSRRRKITAVCLFKDLFVYHRIFSWDLPFSFEQQHPF